MQKYKTVPWPGLESEPVAYAGVFYSDGNRDVFLFLINFAWFAIRRASGLEYPEFEDFG